MADLVVVLQDIKRAEMEMERIAGHQEIQFEAEASRSSTCRMADMSSLEVPSERSFSDLVQKRVAELTTGLVADCERLAVQREEDLRKQCQQLQDELQKLKPNEGGADVKTEPPQSALVAAGHDSKEHNHGHTHDKFDILKELMIDAKAGSIKLEEDYWNSNAARPEHDHGFVDTGSSHHEVTITIATHAHTCVVDPTSHTKLAWDILGIPVLGWDLITIPMQVFDIGESLLIDVMEWVTLIYWSLDVPLTFLTGIYEKDGELIMTIRAIARHYLRGFFSLDFLIISADWISIFINALGDNAPSFLKNMSILRALRITRFIRLTRLTKLKAKWQTVEDNIDSEWNLVLINLLSKMIMIMALNHYIGCVFFKIGDSPVAGYETWLTAHPYPQFGSKENKIEDAAWEYKYITSVHWAITQFTPGSMHVQAQNIPERIFSIFCLMFGLVVFSSFIASVTQARMQLNKMMSKFERDLWLLRKYCRQHKVTHGLTIRMKRYVDMVVIPKYQQMSKKDVVLLPLLSLHLQHELETEMAAQNLHLHPFFQELIKNRAVMTKVCTTAIDNVDFARGDVVFNAGQAGHFMYVVSVGIMEYLPHTKVHQPQTGLAVEVKTSDFVCEAVLWTNWTLQGQLQANMECGCMVIDAHKFRSVIMGNSLVMAFARRYALAFLDGMNKEYKEKSMPCDMQQHIQKAIHMEDIVQRSKAK